MVHGMGKEESLEKLGCRELGASLEGNPVGDVADGINNFPFFVEYSTFLGVVPKHDCFAHDNFAGIRVVHAQDQAKQRRLARPILPHQANSLAPFEVMSHAFKQHPVPKGSLHLVQLDHLSSEAFRDDRQMHGVLPKAFGGGGLDVFEALQSALALGGSCRRGGAHPFQLALHVRLGAFLRGKHVGPAFLTLLKEVAEVALVGVQLLVIDFQDAVADVFQEIPIVRDHQQGGSHGSQALFQPGDHVEVEVVGGLVEDQEVGLLQEHLGQGHPSLFTTAEARNGAVKVVEAQLSEDFPGASFEVPSAMGVHGVVCALQGLLVVSVHHGALVVTHGLNGRAVSYVNGVQNGRAFDQIQVLPQVSMSDA